MIYTTFSAGPIYFYAFNVIEGMDTLGGSADSRGWLLEDLEALGFEVCPFIRVEKDVPPANVEMKILHLRSVANIDYCGIRNLLHLLSGHGFTEDELKKIAARIARNMGADIIFC